MSQIPVVFLHTISQLSSGLVIGTITDGVFPEPGGPIKSGDWKSFVVLSAEVAGQLIVGGLVVVAMNELVEGMPKALQDRTYGTAYSLILWHSQPNLNIKMGRLCSYARDLFSNLLGTTPNPTQVTKGAGSNKNVQSNSQKSLANAYM